MFKRRAVLIGALGVSAMCGWTASAGAQVSMCNQALKMSDGVVMRANVFLPGDGKSKYPVIETVTGYNKDVAHPSGTGCGIGDGISGANPHLVDHGYAVVVIDDRGTGASEGQWNDWDARTQADYGEELDWIGRQPWFNGRLAMQGGSYMGITSLLVAEADALRVKAGKPRMVKAVWADVPMADAYRDVTFHGGAVDAGFIPLWLGLTSGLSDIPPSTLFTDPASAVPTYAGHLADTFQFAALLALRAAVGSENAYDGPFYQLRSPVTRIKDIKIPVAWAGGWWDIFQRGEPLLFEKMVNSPHRHFWMTPNYHGAANPTAWAKQGMGSEEAVTLRWFDRWLKGDKNGIDKTPRVNLYTMGADRWQHSNTWPLPKTKYTRFNLGAKTLSTAAPGPDGGNSIPMLPISSPCSRLTLQWTAGLVPLSSCETDNSSFEATALTYTTPPLDRDTEVTGPIMANVWATITNATDATLVGVVSDVSGSKSTQVTAGFLQASQRAVDKSTSTFAADGQMIRPWHPFTLASRRRVDAGEPTEYQIEIYPTSQVFKKGHRIRFTLNTANTPATLPTAAALLGELGGTIDVLHGSSHQSSLLLPLQGTGATKRSARAR